MFRRQVARWREMTAAERAELADRLSIDVAALATAGIAHKQPALSSEELKRALAGRRYGQGLVEAAYPPQRSA